MVVTLAPKLVVPPTCNVDTLVIAPLISALLVMVKALPPPLRVLPKVTAAPALKVVVVAVLKVIGLPKLIAPVVMMLPPEMVIPADPEEALVVKLAKLVLAPKVLLKVTVPVLMVVRVKP